jgi:predicted nucleic acid-binding protein
MREVFADTYYLLAMHNPADKAHERAVSATAALAGPLVTTEWVLTEFADALADPRDRAGCIGFLEDLRREPGWEVIPATHAIFEAGWGLYRSRRDKAWSLTDCISFQLMEERGIRTALAYDIHFEQAGFEALLRRDPPT